jgi:hypothetical protein
MCHIIKNIYTVCAHHRVGELVECEQQQARVEQWRNGGWCANLQFTLRSCRPVEQAKLKYRFCDECRDHYRHYDTNSADSILNYWAFKNARQYMFSVSPRLVPCDLVFGSAAPAHKVPKVPRLELYALDSVWPRKPFENKLFWLQRLDKARTLTLELAESWDRVVAVRREGTVRTQPGALPPMTVNPHVYALSPITERSASQTTTTRSVPSQVKRESHQVHPETLRKLCREDSSVSFPARRKQAPKPRAAGPKQGGTAIGSRLTSPFDHEVPPPAGHTSATQPPARCLTASKTQQRSNPQRITSTSESAARESVSSRGGKASSGTSGDSTLVVSATSSDLSGEVYNDVGPSEAASKEEEDEPNMTSHFSVSSIDPDDAAELASVRTVSLSPESPVSKDAISVVTAADSAIRIVSPKPVRRPSPPRFIREDAFLAAAGKSTKDRSQKGGQ